ncbi:MAG: hypothetical protein JNM80_03505 [Phycisphaerae bacterium]|nr:hypothetical protein [Phycisphaerae bacterium]
MLFGAYSQEAIVGLPPLNSSNPVNEFISFVWTPTDYAPRSVMFHTATPGELPYRIALLVQPQGGSPFVLPAYVTEGRVTHADTGPIVIVPAPAALSLLLAGLALRRRRREPSRLFASRS